MLSSPALTVQSQNKAATLMCVEAPWVRHVDNESVVRHELCQVHAAQVLGMCGIVGGLLEAAECGHVLEFFIWVFPSRQSSRQSRNGFRDPSTGRIGSGLGGVIGHPILLSSKVSLRNCFQDLLACL